MQKRTTRLLAALLAVVMLLGLTACGKDKTPETSATEVTDVPTTAPPTTTTTAPKRWYNHLTGKQDLTTAANRPIAFVVSDESSSLVQLGVESADMYFEAETEGGIPRMLAIYTSKDRIPNAIGPVRSARPHFVKMAKALDVVYCHIGGSQNGLQTIKRLGVTELTGAYEINPVLRNSANYSWNRSAFTKNKVLAALSSKSIRTTTETTSPFQFGDKAGTTPAKTVNVKISSSYYMAFTYNSTTGLYEKHRNSLSTPIHKTYTGGPIAVSNVIVMFDNRTLDPLAKKVTRYDFDLNSGTGLLASGGTSRQIKWSRNNNRLSYTELDGTPLTVKAGKTYICLTANQFKGATTVS